MHETTQYMVYVHNTITTGQYTVNMGIFVVKCTLAIYLNTYNTDKESLSLYYCNWLSKKVTSAQRKFS